MFRRKGKLLLVFLIFYSYSLVLNLFYISSQITASPQKPTLLPTNPLLEEIYRGLVFIVGLLILIGIINWKKKAVYGYFLFIIIQSTLTDIFFNKSTFPSLGFAILVQSLIFILAFLIIKRKWKFFSY